MTGEGGEAECFRRNRRAPQIVPCEDERAHVGAVSATHSGNVCSMRTRWGVSSVMCHGEWKHMHPNSAEIPPSVEPEPAAAWSVSLGHHLSWRAVVCPLVEEQLCLLLRLLLPPGAPSTRPYFFDVSQRQIPSFSSSTPFLLPLPLSIPPLPLFRCVFAPKTLVVGREGKPVTGFLIDSSRRLDDTPPLLCVTDVDSCCSTAGCLSQVFRIPPTRKREHRCSFLPEPRFRSCGENPLAAHKVLFPVLLASPSPPRPLKPLVKGLSNKRLDAGSTLEYLSTERAPCAGRRPLLSSTPCP